MTPHRIPRFIVVAALGAFMGCASPSATGRQWDASQLDDFFDSMVDRHLEAGYEDPVLSDSDPLLQQRTIVVTASINERTAKDVVSRILYLGAQDPEAPLDLVISTQGGWMDATFAIIDAMEMVRSPVNVWGIGGVYSAGSLILANATGTSAISKNAIVMVHANFEDPQGDHYSSLKLERFERLWRRHTNLPETWFPMTGETSHYLSPQQAVEFGIVDKVLGEHEFPSGHR